MASASRSIVTPTFWENFFDCKRTPADRTIPSEALEWYVDVRACLRVINRCLQETGRWNDPSAVIVHLGSGSSEVGVALREAWAEDSPTEGTEPLEGANRDGPNPFGHRFPCVVDCDFSPLVMAQMGARFPGHSFVCSDARRLPFRSGSVDLLVCKVRRRRT